MSQVTDLTGRKIGEYEVISRIGVGGMGAVYEGRQPLIGKRVAMKVLLPQLSNEQELVERFLAEARAVNEIRHRGIVDIFSFGQLPEGPHYFVMEFLEGEGFDRLIKTRAPLGVGEACSHMSEVLDALGAAHSAGIIHRDIKPSNLFLVNTGRGKPYVKLLDFGIAKLGTAQGESPQTRASVILGTPDYISPEQARGKGISAQTDLYAVGCVLFEMVTGRRVFPGDNTLQTMWAHVEDVPPIPSSIVASIPPALDELILWALEKEPSKRPGSAQEMASHLEIIRASASTGPLTPLPFATASPVPSGVRQRVQAAGTPAPRSGAQPRVLGTPAPNSTSQPPLRTPAPKSGSQAPLTAAERPGETRLSPLTAVQDQPGALTRAEGAPLAPLPAEHGALADEEGPFDDSPPKSKAPLVAVLLVLLAIIGAGIYVLVTPTQATDAPVIVEQSGRAPEPQVAVASTQQTTPEARAVGENDASVPTQATTDAGPAVETALQTERPTSPAEVVRLPPSEPPAPTPTPPSTPKEPPKKDKPLTTAQLEARLSKLEQKLEAREAHTGERDPVLRQIFEHARKEIARANSDAERREAWNTLNDIQAQFGH